MAEKLCELKKKGGGGGRYTETSLWTNSAPTSDFAGGQNVTLSDSLSNYKYVAINFAYSTSYSTGKCNTSIVISVDDFKDMTYNTSDRRNGVSLSVQNISNTSYSRMAIYVSDTSVRFGTCYQVATNTTSNLNCIPLEILGLNELKPGTDVGLVTNGASFSAKTSVTINCKVGDYIALGYGRSASGYSVYWNGTILGQSSDFVTGYSLSTNNFMSIVKASQTSNTFSVASGATLTGGYQIFSLG